MATDPSVTIIVFGVPFANQHTSAFTSRTNLNKLLYLNKHTEILTLETLLLVKPGHPRQRQTKA